MQPTGPNNFARALFGGLPDRYDTLAEILSFGQHSRWRQAMVGTVCASSPGRALDVATGPAGVALALARRCGAWVAGVDITPQMLRAGARNIAKSRQPDRVSLTLGRAEELPFPDGTFDAVMFTYLLRYVAGPEETLRELVRVAKPGAVVASIEFYVPDGPIWGPLWLAYSRVLLPALGYVLGGREWWEVGKFLGPSISAHYRRYPLSWHISAWEKAGVGEVKAKPMSLGGGLVMWGYKLHGSS